MSKNCNQFTFAVDKAMTTPTLNGKLKTIKFADRKIQNLHTPTEKLREMHTILREGESSVFPSFSLDFHLQVHQSIANCLFCCLRFSLRNFNYSQMLETCWPVISFALFNFVNS